MSARGLIPAVPLFVMFVPLAFGQLPKRVEKCLPYPTLTQEIRGMQRPDPPRRVNVSVARVDFDSGDGTPTGVREEISKELQGRNFEQEPGTDYLNELANEIAEVSVRGALQNQGYFQATATAKLAVLQSGATEISVAAVISASPGPQYQAGDIRIESADDRVPLEMPAEKLRDLIPLQRDELFDVERVRAGLRNLTAAYGRLGYVDMTVEPEFQIEDAHNLIDMVLKVDQQAQYRIGGVEFLGVNAATRAILVKSLPGPGEIFDVTRLEEFFRVNQAILPSDASRDDVIVKHDPKSGTVAILFDFRTCPPHSN